MDLRQQLLELRTEAGCAMTESALRRVLTKLVDTLLAEVAAPAETEVRPCYACARAPAASCVNGIDLCAHCLLEVQKR